jgi:hypothetical protein
MLAKLRLDQTATYEQAIAAYEISKMICAFVEGRQHILCIGAEQGDIPGWDDFVIQDRINAFTHLQIKRQQTDFAPEGNCIKNGNQELTPLDKSILSLGGWMATYNPSVNTNSYRFKLCLPHVGPDIKRDFGLRNLRDFMNLHINSTTTTQGLLNLYNTGDTVAVNIYNWLTKWCSFIDWEHIRKVLCVLEIIDYGTETDINTACIAELARVFKEPNDMLLHIKAYTQQNSAYTGSISPRQLLYQLNDYLLDSQKTWTQIDNVNGNWRISGIHDLETNTEVERPSKVIPKLWENNRNRALHINVSPINQVLDPIHERIFHLAIHLQGNVNGLCVNWDGWKVCVESKLGGTLGDKEDDLDNLTISNNNAPYNAIDGRSMNSNAEREEFANEMIAEMTKVTWSLVTQKVSWRISNMNITQSQELRDAVETRWNGWQPILGADIPALTLLLKKMMHPNAEGQEVLGHLRVGPKTKSLIADALFTCLLVSVALD